MIDCLFLFILCEYFTHIGTKSQFSMKGRPTININHLLFTGALFQALKLSSKRNLKILSIYHPQAQWLSLHDPLILIVYQKPDHDHNSGTYAQLNAYT